jgi:hypothetical protein
MVLKLDPAKACSSTLSSWEPASKVNEVSDAQSEKQRSSTIFTFLGHTKERKPAPSKAAHPVFVRREPLSKVAETRV